MSLGFLQLLLLLGIFLLGLKLLVTTSHFELIKIINNISSHWFTEFSSQCSMVKVIIIISICYVIISLLVSQLGNFHYLFITWLSYCCMSTQFWITGDMVRTKRWHTMLSVPPIFYHILIDSTICYGNCTEPQQHGIYLFYIIQKQMSIAMSSMCLSSYRS